MFSKGRSRLTLFGTMFAASLLASCGTTRETSTAIDTFCTIAKPIRLSRSDVLTDETRRQVIEHNRVGMSQCGWE